jgi:hypothetical protein
VFKDAELAQCEGILAGLAPEDRAFLEPRVLPRWLVRRRRLAARNGAIVAARMVFSQPRETVAAKELVRALAGYRLSNWRGEAAIAALPEVSGRHPVLHTVLRLNGGRGLGWRRIAEIWATARNGAVAA